MTVYIRMRNGAVWETNAETASKLVDEIEITLDDKTHHDEPPWFLRTTDAYVRTSEISEVFDADPTDFDHATYTSTTRAAR